MDWEKLLDEELCWDCWKKDWKAGAICWKATEGNNSVEMIGIFNLGNIKANKKAHTRNNSTEGTTKARLEALHDLAHLAEDIVDHGSNSRLVG